MAENQGAQILNSKVELTDALLKAVSQVAGNLDKQSTSVIEGTISRILDIGQGSYEIEYMGTTFPAYASNKNYTYELGDRVYILVPNGDMESSKIIIGLVVSSAQKIKIEDQSTFYIPYGDNLLFLYAYDETTPFALSTYEDNELPEGKPITITCANEIADAFNSALRYTKTFDFTFQIKTEIADAYRRINGNYGLYIKIPIIQGAGIKKDIEITFDINKMLGSPYNFMNYTPQHYYFSIPEDAVVDKNIELKGFVYGFPKEEGHPIYPDDEDLKFIDIGIIPVKAISYEDKAGYNLKLTATKGSFFANNVTGLTKEKDLIPNLYYDGKLIDLSTTKDNYKCYWFVEDYSINTTSLEYNSLGGVGWRILNSKKANTNAEDEDPYITNIFKHTINDLQVRFELKYKCVIVTKDNEVLSDFILIKNLSSKIKLNLTTSTGSNKYIADLGSAELIMTYFDDEITNDITKKDQYEYHFYWQRYNRVGTPINFDYSSSEHQEFVVDEENNRSIEDRVSCEVISIDQVNTFQCTVILVKIINTSEHDPDEDTQYVVKSEEYIIGSRSISIVTTEEINLNIFVENDVRYYKYDWSGNSPMVANYDGNATDKEKLIKPIYITKITDENGQEYTEKQLETFEIEWFIPADVDDDEGSMFDLLPEQRSWKKEVIEEEGGRTYYHKRGYFKDMRSLNYGIKNQYNQSYANKGNNVIILKAYLDSKGKEVTKYINNIIFEKDGKSGTNGTNYTGVIVYGPGHNGEVYEYGELDPSSGLPHKFQLLFINNMKIVDNKPKGEWFVYNPAWVGKTGITGNHLGLLHITDNTSEDINSWIKIRYSKFNSEGIEVTEEELIKPWGLVENANLFEIEMYCQGEKIIYNEKTQLLAEWALFDEIADYDGIISPISVSTTSGSEYIDYNGCGLVNILESPPPPAKSDLTWEDVWTYEVNEQEQVLNPNDDEELITYTISSYSVMAILQAKAQAKQIAGSNPDIEDKDATNSPFYVYAYYPIEVTYLSDQSMISNYIPSIVGGFDNIIYNRGGLNPEYGTKPFHIIGVDKIEQIEEETLKKLGMINDNKKICEYKWSYSRNLFNNDDQEATKYANSVNVQPTNKFKNAFTKNYVKVQVDFSDDLRETLNEERIAATEASDELYNIYSVWSDLDEAVNVFDLFNYDSDSCPYKSIKKIVSDNAYLLTIAQNYVEVLNKIKVELELLQENFRANLENAHGQEYYDEYLNFLNNTITNKYIQAIKHEINDAQAITKAENLQEIEYLLGDIAHIFEQEDYEPLVASKRYLFTDDEQEILNDIFSYITTEGNQFLTKIKENCSLYEVFIKSSEYVSYFTKIQNSLEALGDMSSKIIEIKGILNDYLSEGPDPTAYYRPEQSLSEIKKMWRKVLTFNTYNNEKLQELKQQFLNLNKVLWTYYYNVTLGDITIDPFNIVLTQIDKMNSALNPYKNFTEIIIEEENKVSEEFNTLQHDKIQSLNRICELIKEDDKYQVIHTKPIIMLMNRYELGYLNDWDGNKLKIDENGGYIMSPIVGAGRKEDDNSFTGITMGIYNSPESENFRIGLFGHNRGKETIFLDSQTGAAIFGSSGDSQIYIDPDPSEGGGRLYSGNYYDEYGSNGKPNYQSHIGNGMLIHLRDGYIHFGKNSNAKLYSGDHIKHKTVTKTIIDGEEYINVTYNTEPGFCLDPYGLSIGKGIRIEETGEFYFGYGDENSDPGERKYIHFDPAGDGTFKIGEDVVLTATDISADAINGKELVIRDGGCIKSEKEINGQPSFKLDENGVTILDGEIHLVNGEINLGIGGNDGYKFQVTSEGALTAQKATIRGVLTAETNSRIGEWYIGQFTETVYGYEQHFNGCLIGRDGGEDMIRMYPQIGKIGFKDSDGFVYIGADSTTANSKDTLFIKKTVKFDGTNDPGNLNCGKITCQGTTNGYAIIANGDTRLAGNINNLDYNIESEIIMANNYFSMNENVDASSSNNGQLKITKTGIYKCIPNPNKSKGQPKYIWREYTISYS